MACCLLNVVAKADWANHHKSPTAAMMEDIKPGLSQILFYFLFLFQSLPPNKFSALGGRAYRSHTKAVDYSVSLRHGCYPSTSLLMNCTISLLLKCTVNMA